MQKAVGRRETKKVFIRLLLTAFCLLPQERKPHLLSLFEIPFCTESCQSSHPQDISYPFSHADRTPRIEKVEDMGSLQAIIVGRKDQSFLDYSLRLSLKHIKKVEKHLHVGFLKIIS